MFQIQGKAVFIGHLQANRKPKTRNYSLPPFQNKKRKKFFKGIGLGRLIFVFRPSYVLYLLKGFSPPDRLKKHSKSLLHCWKWCHYFKNNL